MLHFKCHLPSPAEKNLLIFEPTRAVTLVHCELCFAHSGTRTRTFESLKL